MRAVTFTHRGKAVVDQWSDNHDSNMAIVDLAPMRVRAVWAFHSIAADVGGATKFFGFGPLAGECVQPEFSVAETDRDADAIRGALRNEETLMQLLSLYACYSGNLTEGRCDCVAVETAWPSTAEIPTVTLDLDFHGLVGASDVKELAEEMRAISAHYHLACDVNPVFVSVSAR